MHPSQFIDALAVQVLERDCPRLPQSSYSRTSPRDKLYNCIAWAAGDTARWWWPPHPLGGYAYWPHGLPNDQTIANFERAYETVGYSRCPDGAFDEKLEKIAIYALNGVPTHAARQLSNGKWTSKCGKSFDIEHELPEDVGGGIYGDVVLFMSRGRTQATSPV
jgi:hypothetical protein